MALIVCGLEEETSGTEFGVATMVAWTGCGKSGAWCPDAAGARVPLPYRNMRLGQLRTGGMVTFQLVSLVEWLLQQVTMVCTRYDQGKIPLGTIWAAKGDLGSKVD